MKTGDTLIQRFSAKYIPEPNSGCWLWTAGIYKGYGRIAVNGKNLLAHRVSYELFNGPIPSGDKHHDSCVLHKCDTPSCVNPSHLFWGSQADNIADMNNKNRGKYLRGEKHYKAKLSKEQALEIFNSQDDELALSQKYGVHRATVWCIKKKQSWKNIHE